MLLYNVHAFTDFAGSLKIIPLNQLLVKLLNINFFFKLKILKN